LGDIPDQVLDEIRDRGDLAEIVGRYVTLRQSGSRLMGLCPFHQEKTPSFSVNRERQIYYCFGCGASGDLFAFRMNYEGLGFREAVRAIADELGIQIPESGPDSDGGQRKEERDRAARLYSATSAALAYFRTSLRSPSGTGAGRYLEERGLSLDLIDRFQVGYAPPEGLLAHLRSRGISVEDAEMAGLISPSKTHDGHYDRFRARVMFPIIDLAGRVEGFGGRSLDGDPKFKYMNSPETPIYRKSSTLFGLSLARQAIRERSRAIIVEGYFDVVAVHRAGLSEVVAPCGTALTAEHARLLRRFTDEVILLFDGDAAGQKAAEKSLRLLAPEHLYVRAAFLPADEDPDTLVQRRGAAALRELIEGAEDLIAKRVDEHVGLARANPRTTAAALREISEMLCLVQDRTERKRYVQDVARRLELTVEDVKREIREAEQRKERAVSASLDDPPHPGEAAPAPLELDSVVSGMLVELIRFPELVHELDSLCPGFTQSYEQFVPDARIRELLGSVFDASERHAGRWVAHLLSPAEEALRGDARASFTKLVEAASKYRIDDVSKAREALRDCLSKLKAVQNSRALKATQDRRTSCTEPGEHDLWQEAQRLLEEKRRRSRQQQTYPRCT